MPCMYVHVCTVCTLTSIVCRLFPWSTGKSSGFGFFRHVLTVSIASPTIFVLFAIPDMPPRLLIRFVPPQRLKVIYFIGRVEIHTSIYLFTYMFFLIEHEVTYFPEGWAQECEVRHVSHRKDCYWYAR